MTAADLRQQQDELSADRLGALEQCAGAFAEIQRLLRLDTGDARHEALEIAIEHGLLAAGHVETAFRLLATVAQRIPAGVADLEQARARRAGRS